MHESRFKEHLKQQAYKNVLLAALGIVALILIIIFFGAQLLIGFSLLVGKLTGRAEPVSKNRLETNYISPPQLDVPVEATNSASIMLTGSSDANQTIHLYRNDRRVEETKVNSREEFTFRSITLQRGKNTFKAKSIQNNIESDFSNAVTVTYLTGEPTLTVINPQDGENFRKDGGQVKVEGETDPGATVTVNDFRAIIDSSGNYTYSYALKDGENRLRIVATDEAGNKATKELTIKAQ